jgi:hypothetical protein
MTERTPVKYWIAGSAACVAAGWILSALHELNRAGYAVFLLVLAAGWAAASGRKAAKAKWARWNPRRFRRPLPLLYLLTAALAFFGGALYAPNNYDALAYRFPRVLHWWADSGWHWIATPVERMNLSGTGFEWLMMPLLVLTHSDRFFFLLNVIPYLLLPGLVFLVFTAAGATRRVAWFWMWVLPSALCYAMQAGSISNDTIAVTYFLAAIYFACEARRTGEVRNLWLAFLAAGLLTAVKATNLPLLLPIAWAMWPALRLVKSRFVTSAAVVCVSLLVSYLPTAALNRHFTGDWTGDPNNIEKIKAQKPLGGILGNSLQLALQSVEPPFLPLAHSVENWVSGHLPEHLRAVLQRDFPRFVVGFRELPQEESAGVGIGITAMALVSIMAALFFRHRNLATTNIGARRRGLIIGLLTWGALLFFMTKLGSESTSRLIAAYYPLLLLPCLLNPAQDFLVRRRWFKALGICTATIAILAVILTPSRPLWPAECFFDWTLQRYPENAMMARARMVFAAYRCRNDLFAGLRRSIPESVPVIGLIEGVDDAETSLWRPYGARRVVHVAEGDRSQESRLHWLVVKNSMIERDDPAGFDHWMQRDGGTLIAREAVTEKIGAGPEQWSVVHFPGDSK